MSTVTIDALSPTVEINTTTATIAYTSAQLRDLSGSLGRSRAEKTTTYTVVDTDRGLTIDCTAGTYAVNLDAAATLGNGWHVIISNTGTGVITIDPNASELITGPNGSSTTITLTTGQSALLVCTGTGWTLIAATAGLIDAATVAVPNGSAATLASVPSADFKATSWDVYAAHTDGRRHQAIVWARLDAAGTDVDYSENGPDDNGDWTGTITCDLSSGNIRLLVAGTETDWTAYSVRSFMKAGI